MVLNVKAITDAINKIAEMVSGERVIPGLLLKVGDNDLKVCYSDGKKSFVESIPKRTEEGDLSGEFYTTYEQFKRAIDNCQPSGAIVVREMRIEFNGASNIFKISAEQELMIDNEVSVEYRSVARKEMDVSYIVVAGSTDQRVKLLSRMNYDTIFEPEGSPDTWDRTELASILSNMSFEKGKVVYMSPKNQKVFVVNTGFTCAMPISSNSEGIVALFDNNTENQSADKIISTNRLTYQIILTSINAKCIANILGKMKDDTVKMYVKANFLFIYNEDETVGMCFDTAKGSSTHTSNFSTFANMQYGKYQMTFIREFLADSIKSALNSSKSEKIALTFKQSDTNISGISMVISSSNSSANISDTYSVEADSVLDVSNTLLGDTITISLKVFADMLGQLKSTMVALDIEETAAGQMCLRLAELNDDKVYREWALTRNQLGLAEGEPTPAEVKIGYRDRTLDTCQYCILSR